MMTESADKMKSFFFFASLFLCVLPQSSSSGKLLELICADSTGEYNDDTVINCTLKSVRDDIVVTKLLWMREALMILNITQSYVVEMDSRVRLFHQPWDSKRKDVSLLIKRAKSQDEGNYKCMVVTDGGYDNTIVKLKLQAPYSTPVIVHPWADSGVAISSVSCISEGGYPKGQIQWSDERGTVVTEGSDLQVTQASDGRYFLNNTLTISRELIHNYTCSVIKQGVTEGTAVLTSVLPGSGDSKERLEFTAVPKPDRTRWPLILTVSSLATSASFLLYKIFKRIQHNTDGGAVYSCVERLNVITG
nr:PREDICTED: butyrophilin subfamily 1 member A1-like isoform X2 [Lepisosteus oculatus]